MYNFRTIVTIIVYYVVIVIDTLPSNGTVMKVAFNDTFTYINIKPQETIGCCQQRIANILDILYVDLTDKG